MTITDSTTYEFDLPIDKYSLNDREILVVRYPLYEISCNQIKKMHGAMSKELEMNMIFLPDDMSLAIMPTWELEKLAKNINDLLAQRKDYEKQHSQKIDV